MQDAGLSPELSHITAWLPRGDSTHRVEREAASPRRDRGACGLEYEGQEQAARSPRHRHRGKRCSAELQDLYWLVGQSHGALCSEKTLPQAVSLVETEGLATDGTFCRVACPRTIPGASSLGAPSLGRLPGVPTRPAGGRGKPSWVPSGQARFVGAK